MDDKQKAESYFNKTLEDICKHTPASLEAEFQKKSEAWFKFCEGVVLFYSARQALHGDPIPISGFDTEDGKFVRMNPALSQEFKASQLSGK